MTARLLGIDVGTGGTRAVTVSQTGEVEASATAEHAPFAADHEGWAEQDPHDWWRACKTAVKLVLQKAEITGSDIHSISFSGQMHGAVLLDAAGEVIRPALIWCDQRTSEEGQDIERMIGRERLIELTANTALTNFTATKLLWVRKHEPEAFARMRMLQLPKDYVRFRLTGNYAIDVADASGTLLFDVAHRRWSVPVCEALGISLPHLPPVHECIAQVGVVSVSGAQATGLRQGTPVIVGAGDQAAGAVGMGIVRPGWVSSTIGTSGVVFAATDRPALDPQGRLHTFCHAIPGRWHVMGVTQAAGLSLRWFREAFRDSVGFHANGDPYDALAEEAAQAPAGSDGVLWAPYLMGERTPYLDPHARAGWVGITARHRRPHLIRALMEGVAFSLRDTLEIFREMRIAVQGIRAGGGGARSALWRQIQADTFGFEVEQLAAEEGAAFGAALLAGVGTGVWATVDEASKKVDKVKQVIPPNSSDQKTLEAGYQRYRRLYGALRSIYSD